MYRQTSSSDVVKVQRKKIILHLYHLLHNITESYCAFSVLGRYLRLSPCRREYRVFLFSKSHCKDSYLRNREVSGILDVTGLLIQLRKGGVHTLVLTVGLAVLICNRLLWRGASLGFTVHWRWEHLQDKEVWNYFKRGTPKCSDRNDS